MKFDLLFSTVAVLLVSSVPVRGLFGSSSLQDYIESFIDDAKVQLEEAINLNDSAIGQIWSYFKTDYGRVYSSLGED
jgi:hypothetical protein